LLHTFPSSGISTLFQEAMLCEKIEIPNLEMEIVPLDKDVLTGFLAVAAIG
jgi:hypothetical protein